MTSRTGHRCEYVWNCPLAIVIELNENQNLKQVQSRLEMKKNRMRFCARVNRTILNLISS